MKSDEAVCFEILPKVSRSFALAIEALPQPLKTQVCVAYLLCRIVDTIEDHPYLPQRTPYFDAFDFLLHAPASTQSPEFSTLSALTPPQSGDAELYRVLKEVFAVYWEFPVPVRGVLLKNILEMSQGMRGYTAQAGGIVLQTNDDLDRYCYYVAGTVGNLLTEIFFLFLNSGNSCSGYGETWRKRQSARGYHFALGLQKVNMVKDVVKDLRERGSLFVPQDWLNTFEVTPADLLQGEKNPRVRALLYYFLRQAAEHLEAAKDYILELPAAPRGLRLFCIWPYVMAIETLRLATQKSGLFTADHEVKVSRKEMYRMMKATEFLAKSRPALQVFLNHKLGRLMDSI